MHPIYSYAVVTDAPPILVEAMENLRSCLRRASAVPARGEVIELVDKTKLNGKVIHYYDGVYSIEANGQTIKLPKEKIRSISFQLPPPRPEFSTPEKTFERWRKSLTEGAVEKTIDCYALMYQGMLATQMGLGDAQGGLKKMQKEIEGTKFQIKGSSTKGSSGGNRSAFSRT